MKTMRFIALALMVAVLAGAMTAHAANGIYNVRTDYGAVGDGSTNDTTAFQNALNQANSDGGGKVIVPTGKYKISTHLTIPSEVILEGVWRTPMVPTGAFDKASTLLASENQGTPGGTPFIVMNADSTISGINIYYPDQTATNPPLSYPWTIRGNGTGCTLRNVTIVNPYQAVDFGSNACNQHSINGLYAQPLYRGILLDKCTTGGDLRNIKFWPLWSTATNITTYTRSNCIGFQFGQVKDEIASNLEGNDEYVTFKWADLGNGLGSGAYTNMIAYCSSTAFKIDGVDATKGISIANGQSFTLAEVTSNNTGPVKFTGVAFWSSGDSGNGFTTSYIANLAGTGHVKFVNCNFDNWDRTNTGTAAIVADCKSVLVEGCTFTHASTGEYKIDLNSNCRSANVVGNRMQRGVLYHNNTTTGSSVFVNNNTAN